LRLYPWIILELFLLICGAAAMALGGWMGFWVGAAYLVIAMALTRIWLRAPWSELMQILSRLKTGDFKARLHDLDGWYLPDLARAINRTISRLEMLFEDAEQREKRLRAILDAGGEGILFVSSTSDVLLVSTSAARLVPGAREGLSVTRLELNGLTGLVQLTRETQAVQAATLSERSTGTEHMLETRCIPLGDDGTAVFLQDVTEEHRLNRVKSDLVANVSHELRTPVCSIVSLTEELNEEDLSPEERKDFQGRLLRQALRMQSLVEDLLSLSRLERGQNGYQEKELDLRSVARSVLEDLRELSESFEVTLVNDIPEGFGLQTREHHLRTVLKNVVDNAIRYNREGGRVTLSATAGEDLSTLVVKDTGEGIPAEHLPRVFERFYRVSARRSREKGGTGLGLSIVKHAVQGMGAEIDIESTPEEGTAVTIRFPFRDESDAPKP